MDSERVLGSSCRRKILRLLSHVSEMNIIGIIQKVNSTYSQVNPSLQILANEGIILDQRLGRIRLIKLNQTYSTKALVQNDALISQNLKARIHLAVCAVYFLYYANDIHF